MSNNLFEFYPEFNDYITLYRGIERMWIADGTEENPGYVGYLYAKFVGKDDPQNLGSIIGFDAAQEEYPDLTYDKWIQALHDSPANAEQVTKTINNMNKGLSTEITYVNSTDGKTKPTEGWTEDLPTPEPGKFTWTKAILSWPGIGISDVEFDFVTGYKESIATIEDIEANFENPEGEWEDSYASEADIINLFPELKTSGGS